MSRARLVGIAAAAGSVLVLALFFNPPTPPWAQPFQLNLEAGSFGQLNPAASVDLAGVKVGSVEGLGLEGGHAVVRLSIDRGYVDRLHADTSADIRPHGLLGPRYIDLNGGSRGWLQDGATIPISRVHVSTDLDQVLNSLQPDVRQSLRTVLVELGTGSDGRGQDVNATIQALGKASDDLARVTATLRGRDQDLAQSVVAGELVSRDVQQAPLDAQIRDTDQVLTGLVKVDDSIGTGIDHTAVLLQQLDVVMDGNSANLARTLDEGPATVARLRAVLATATSIVNGINPAVPSLMTATVETESAFSAADANGHYARIMVLTGTCTAGLNLGCAQGPSQSPSPSPAQPGAAAGATSTSAPRSHTSDQQLERLLLGNP